MTVVGRLFNTFTFIRRGNSRSPLDKCQGIDYDHAGKKPGVGEFTAEVDGVPFLKTNVVVLHFANEDYFILGYEGDMNKVVFSVPTALPGEGPHKVEHYHDGLQWDVTINERKSLVGSGSTTVTFDKNRDSIEGTIDFTLEDKRKVTGKFNITNKW